MLHARKTLSNFFNFLTIYLRFQEKEETIKVIQIKLSVLLQLQICLLYVSILTGPSSRRKDNEYKSLSGLTLFVIVSIIMFL